jgi:hypothetical protein
MVFSPYFSIGFSILPSADSGFSVTPSMRGIEGP